MFINTKAVKSSIVATLIAVCTSLTSCDSLLYQEEGDCNPTYRVRFKYDMNMKWADAFANEVKSVRLYIFDQSETLVSTYYETSDKVLSSSDYTINLDLDPGKYTLLAWCGVDNPEAVADHFYIPSTQIGETSLSEVTCMLNRANDPSFGSVVDKRLEFMFHGLINIELPAEQNGGDYIYTIPLTKDTNHLRVVLQHLSGEDLDVSQFNFRLQDANGFYASDNSLMADDMLTYLPFKTSEGVASIVRNNTSSEIKKSKTAIADISLGRLMASRLNDMILTITNGDGKDIARIPVIDYALLSKDYYEVAYNHEMSDQEFLDRQDEYIMTFFIDENNEWYSAEIYIESWRIVFQNVSQ